MARVINAVMFFIIIVALGLHMAGLSYETSRFIVGVFSVEGE